MGPISRAVAIVCLFKFDIFYKKLKNNEGFKIYEIILINILNVALKMTSHHFRLQFPQEYQNALQLYRIQLHRKLFLRKYCTGG